MDTHPLDDNHGNIADICLSVHRVGLVLEPNRMLQVDQPEEPRLSLGATLVQEPQPHLKKRIKLPTVLGPTVMPLAPKRRRRSDL